MNVFVINGSPKGKWSITLQTVEFLRLSHPEDSFTIYHAGQRIHALEKDLAPVLEGLQAADLIVFAYPVYTFFAPSQLHRLIELIKASGVDLAGKYATQITTSKHFYDVTAHGYIEDNCHDLGLRYLRGLSADMEDLLSEQGRREAESFWTRICRSMKQGYCEPCRTVPVVADHRPVTIPSPVQKRPGDVVIITDSGAEDANLAGMIARFQAVLPVESRVVDLREYPFKSGCLGCFGCASDGKCVIKDGFDDFLRNSLQSAQAIIYAFSIRDHSMGARFKLYDDRQFCNGHRTVTEG
ncbi:MAG: iron-sulfur protein, partial [Ruminococcaceae bacterium]|nr:iron-sulfur protein [Oscillospiraceae bacterium]